MPLNLNDIENAANELFSKPDQSPLTQPADQGVSQQSVDDAVIQLDDERARLGVLQAQETQPDQVVEDQDIAEKTGVPAPAVPLARDDLRKQVTTENIMGAVASSPKLKKLLGDRSFSAIAVDDTDTLTKIEGLFEDISEDISQKYKRGKGTISTARGVGEELFAVYEAGLEPSADLRARIKEAQNNMAGPEKDLNFFLGIPGAMAEQIPILGEMFASSADEATMGLAAGGAATVATGGLAAPLMIAGTGFGFTTGAAKFTYDLESRLALVDMDGVVDEKGNRLDPEVSLGAARIIGAINAGFELGGFLKVARTVPGVGDAIDNMKNVIRGRMKQALKTQSGREAVKKFVKNLGSATFYEGFTEFAQSIVSQSGTEIVKGMSEGDFEGKSIWAILGEAAHEGRVGAQAGFGFGTPGASISLGVDIKRARQAKQNQQFFENLSEQAVESKTRERNETMFQTFIREAAGGTSASHVYVPADKFVELYQSNNIDADAAAQDLGVTDLQEAIDIGGDVKIPVEQFATKIAATEYYKTIAGDLKLAPEAMTANEAIKYDQEIQERVEQEVERLSTQNEGKSEEEIIRSEVFSKLRAVGQSVDVAGNITEAIVSEIASSAAMDNVSPLEMYSRYPLDFSRVLPETLQMRMDTPTGLDMIIQRVISGQRGSQNELFGQSLIDFVRERGVRFDPEGQAGQMDMSGRVSGPASDPMAGDLTAMDIDVGLKPGQRKALRPEGMTLDDLALAAQEAGFFGTREDRIDINELLEVISDNLSGQLTFAEDAQNQDAIDMDQAADDLAAALDAIDVDPSGMTLEEVRKIIEDNESRSVGDGGIELFHPAFHGTMADELAGGRFRLDYVGDRRFGEGAQAYGYGLYFASERAVSETYRRRAPRHPLTRTLPAVKFKGKIVKNDVLAQSLNDIEFRMEERQTKDKEIFEALKYMSEASLRAGLRRIEQGFEPNSGLNALQITGDIGVKIGPVKKIKLRRKYKAALKAMEKLEAIDDIVVKKAGSLYKVELAPEFDDYLDYDLPYAQQSPKVKKILDRLFYDKRGKDRLYEKDRIGHMIYDLKSTDKTGGEIYRDISIGVSRADSVGFTKADAKVSQMLMEAGIPGIKYQDGFTRGQTNKILEVEGTPIDSRFSDDQAAAQYYIEADGDINAAINAAGKFYKITLKDLAAKVKDKDSTTRQPAVIEILKDWKETDALLEITQDHSNHNFVIFDDSLIEITGQQGVEFFQSVTLRDGQETLEEYGISPGEKYNTRVIAEALEERQREKYGTISNRDNSPEAMEKIASWMTDEVMFELQPDRAATSGAGWYSEKFKNALDIFGSRFPELTGTMDTNLPGVALLGSQQNARDFFTALIAVTSDGQKVKNNFTLAMTFYEEFRNTGKLPLETQQGGERVTSFRSNLKMLSALLEQDGPEQLHTKLLTEDTVSELGKIAKKEGLVFNAKYPADRVMPMAAVLFGPKLGAFYANLMGAHGYLTMDRWWSRSFNRYRGSITASVKKGYDSKGKAIGLTRFKELLVAVETRKTPANKVTNDSAMLAVVKYRNNYEAKGYKDGTEIEKAANTIYKDAYEKLEDQPARTSDRGFMIDAVNRAQEMLAEQGTNITVADIQAVLWYYEKRLYGELGARQTADISYEEVAKEVATAQEDMGRREDRQSDSVYDVQGPDGAVFSVPQGKADGLEASFSDASAFPVYQSAAQTQQTPARFEMIDANIRAVIGYNKTRGEKHTRFFTRINIDDFLDLTTTDASRSFIETDEFGTSNLEPYQEIRQEFDPAETDRPDTNAIPHLTIDKDGKVLGHEGRHRAAALKRGGATTIPIQIKFYDSNRVESVPRILGGEFQDNIQRQIGDSIAATDENFDAIRELVGEGSDTPITFMQDKGGPRGGFIPGQGFGQGGRSVIRLFEGADLTTTLHELSHFYLEKMRDRATRPMSSQQLKDDWATLESWWRESPADIASIAIKEAKNRGIEIAATAEDAVAYMDNGTTGNEQLDQFMFIAQHELTADAHEVYLQEGKAPSIELGDAFERFSAWMMRVYGQVIKMVRPTEEVKEVFDRWYATGQQIEQAKEVNQMMAMFKSAEEMGVSEEAYQAYVNRDERTKRTAKNKLLKRKMIEIGRQQKAEAQAIKDEIYTKVEDEINSKPVYRAWAWLSQGRVYAGDPPAGLEEGRKLSKAALEEIYGTGVTALLPKGGAAIHQRDLPGKVGYHPDQVAEEFGFDSGDALISAIRGAPSRKEFIKQEQEIRLENDPRWQGDLAQTGAIEEAAIEDLHNDERGLFLHQELAALAQRNDKAAPTPAAVMREVAKRTIAEKGVNEAMQPGRYRAAETKAGKEAEIAFAENKLDAAQEAKRRQLLNHYLYTESLKFKEQATKDIKYFNKFAGARSKLEKIDPVYVEKIQTILAAYQFTPRLSSRKQLVLELQAINDWVNKRNVASIDAPLGSGEFISIPQRILEADETTHFRDLTVKDFRALKDAIKNLETQGRNKSKLLTGEQDREVDEIASELFDSITENFTGEFVHPNESKTDWEKRKSKMNRSWGLRKVEFIFRQMDGFKFGPLQKHIFSRIARADDTLSEMKHKAALEMKEVLGGYSWREFRNLSKEKIFIEELGTSLTKEDMLGVALYSGAPDNLQKMMDGRGFTKAQVDAVLRQLSPNDWKAVNGIFKHLETYWQATVDLDKRTRGYAAPKLETQAIIIDGQQVSEGGYFPLKFNLNADEKSRSDKDPFQDILDGTTSMSSRPTTSTGRTMERLDGAGGRVVRLDGLGIYLKALDETTHDLAWRETISDVGKIMKHPDFRRAILATRGEAGIIQLNDWVLDSVMGDVRDPRSSDEFFAHVRRRLSIMTMGVKLSTALVQPLGIFSSFALFVQENGVGPGLAASLKGIKRAVSKGGRQEVLEKSAMMRERGRTFDRDVYDNVKHLKGGAIASYEASFFWMVGKLQSVADTPTWLAAYDIATTNNPNITEAEAVAIADSAIRVSQSSGAAKDLSSFQKGSEGMKLLGMYMTFFNAMTNMMIEQGMIIKADKKKLPRMVAAFFLMTFVPVALQEGLYGAAGVGGPDEDEDQGWIDFLLRRWLGFTVGGVPLVRDAVGYMVEGYPFSTTPFVQAAKTGVETFPQLKEVFYDDGFTFNADELDKKLAKSALTLAGLASPIAVPTSQLWLTGEYLYDFWDDEVEADNPINFLAEAFVKKDYQNR